MEYFIDKVKGLLKRVTLSCLDKELQILVEHDKKWPPAHLFLVGEPRVYLKVVCMAADRNTGQQELQHGRKWYLSEHMPDDEIIKTAFAAYDRFIDHEAKEGFKIDGKPIFNPHTDFEELLKVCEIEVKRKSPLNV
jgi:hypothetical protein